MTVIRPNSITGITSITAQANEINVFRHNGVLAGLQLNGVNHHTSAGVSTFHTVNVLGNLDVAGVLTYQDVTNVDSLGIGTFRTGINVSGGQLDVGSNIKLGNAGVITATSFSGSGANLTSLPAQASIANNADNRVITGGSGVNLNGEANLTFDGTGNFVQSGSAAASIMRVETTANDGDALIQADGRDSSGNLRRIMMRTDAGADQYRIISSDTSYDLALCTGNAPRLIITGSGRIEIGEGTHINASAPMEFKVSSSSSWGNYPEHITLTDQKAYNAADNGAGIQFGGKYNTAGNATTFGSIHAKKATTADGNYGGILTFNTREHGNSNFERLRIDSIGRVFINAVNGVVPSADYRSLNLVSHAHSEAGISFSRDHTLMGSGGSHGYTIILNSAGSLLFNTHNVAERMRIDSNGRVVVGGTAAYIGGANLAVMGTGTTQNTYGSFAIGKIGANPTANTALANIRLNGGSAGTRRGAEINAVANGNWTDGSSHPTKLTFAVANVNSASATQRFEINHYGHMVFTNENVMPSSGSAGTNGFKGLTQLGYQHWGQRQYYSGQRNMAQNDTFDLFSNNVAHDDIIFWLNIKGYHANRTFATAHGAIGGYGLSVSYQSASGVYGAFSAANIASGRNMLRWTSNSPHGANWWIWGWFSGTSSTGTHTGWSAAQLH